MQKPFKCRYTSSHVHILRIENDLFYSCGDIDGMDLREEKRMLLLSIDEEHDVAVRQESFTRFVKEGIEQENIDICKLYVDHGTL